ncbi:MAG: hypothetical protein LBH66_01500, partial [Oscillospiraceae bacterium]|nr:hypothetical protein [Oscillospiraceae bacterium]
MNYELPSLKLTAPEDWPNQRLAWLALAEEHMYGHAPVDPAVRGEIIASEPVWDGAGVRETARIYYGLGLKWSFDSTIHRPAREGRRPVITWNQFKPEDPCPPLREIVADRGYIVAAFDKSQLTHDNNDGLPGRLDAREAYPNYDWGAIRIWAWGHQKLA